MVRVFLLLSTLLFSLPLYALTELKASVDKNPVLKGESITLTVSADARFSADELDFSALKKDFTVMLPSVSSSTQIINGQASQSTVWRVVLLPKKSGNFTIPAFTLNGLSSAPINLEVLSESLQNSTQSKELFLLGELEKTDIYVQQLTYYTVTIFFNGDLQRGSLTEPQLDDATVIQVGQDVEGSELVNGTRYRTITRRYALTAQKSGQFTLIPPTFTGEMVDRSNYNYNAFSRTKTVVQQAEPVDITVKPTPANFQGSWLVAALVTLNEEWTADTDKLKQGEPITRIITLSAIDITPNQLPDLPSTPSSNVRLYQEQPQAKSGERNNRLVAQKVFTTAIIANDSGDITLPEISLPWWNSQTNKIEYATLPAKTLKVQAVTTSTKAVNANELATQVVTVEKPTSPWQWNYLSSLLLSLWLVSLFVIYVLWQLHAPAKTAPTRSSRVSFNNSALKKACQKNDAKAAKHELLRFAHQQLDIKSQSLTDLYKVTAGFSLHDELKKLNAALYASDNSSWQGNALWEAWLAFNQNTKPQDEPSALKPLYPQ